MIQKTIILALKYFSDGDAGDENIDFPVEDRLTGDENHLIYIGIRICNIKKNFMT